MTKRKVHWLKIGQGLIWLGCSIADRCENTSDPTKVTCKRCLEAMKKEGGDDSP